LALSTIFLWISTRDAARAGAKATKIAERALTELEAPFMALNITHCGVATHWISKDGCRVEQISNGLMYGFFNHGRTPAVLLELEDKLQICAEGELPTLQWPPERKRPYPYGVFVGADKSSAGSTRNFVDYFDQEIWETFSDGTSNLFLVGKLTFRDIFQNTFEMGFCAVFNRANNNFLMEGGDTYNYRHEIKT
jgi:hypothetical protein